jgi:hypothetical protein
MVGYTFTADGHWFSKKGYHKRCRPLPRSYDKVSSRCIVIKRIEIFSPRSVTSLSMNVRDLGAVILLFLSHMT